MLNKYSKKIKFIFLEEGIFNTIIRIVRYMVYKIKRSFSNSSIDLQNWHLLKKGIEIKRVFLIGNGPSLNMTPLHLLNSEVTFCMNRFNLMFERLPWRPDMFAICDDVVILDMLEEIRTIKNEVKYFFLPDIHPSSPVYVNYKKIIHDHDKIYWFHPDKIVFSSKLPSLGINKTVANVAIQILVYLGFKEIYLIGVDLDYKTHKTANDFDNRHLESNQNDDPNHFDPRYFGAGRKYHIPRMKETFDKFKEAKQFCDKHNVKIYNATIGGKLEVFPRVKFRSIFNISLEDELDLLLGVLNLSNNGYKSFGEAFPTANKISKNSNWDMNSDFIISPFELGYDLIPKHILSHIPLGPFNDEYLFIKREKIFH